MEKAKKYKKLLYDTYKAKEGVVSEIDIPKRKYLKVTGQGKPGDEDFQDAIGELYSTAYTIKFLPKSDIKIPGYFKGYAIGALEGVYDPHKATMKWNLIIPQPDFVNSSVINKAKKFLKGKDKPEPKRVELYEWEEGLSIQSMHIGAYDAIEDTSKLIHDYAKENDLTITGKHHEIYISDPRRVPESKLKTVYRYAVSK